MKPKKKKKPSDVFNPPCTNYVNPSTERQLQADAKKLKEQLEAIKANDQKRNNLSSSDENDEPSKCQKVINVKVNDEIEISSEEMVKQKTKKEETKKRGKIRQTTKGRALVTPKRFKS